MINIKAIIYDVDGTLINSEPVHVRAWDSALQHYNHRVSDLSHGLQSTMAGKKPLVIAQIMIDELQLPIDAKTLLKYKTDTFMALADTIDFMPGAVDSIKRFKIAGYKLGIGTSLDREYLAQLLNRQNILDLFDSIVTGDQVANGKPHPETYLTVANTLDLEPSECLVLEDATSGVKAAKSAGVWCIAIKNHNAVNQDLSNADITVSSLCDVTQKLVKSLSAA